MTTNLTRTGRAPSRRYCADWIPAYAGMTGAHGDRALRLIGCFLTRAGGGEAPTERPAVARGAAAA